MEKQQTQHEKQLKYPPWSSVVEYLLRDWLFQNCVWGYLLTHVLFPLYQCSRVVAKEYGMNDTLYFTLIVAVSHTFMFVVYGGVFGCLDHFQLLQQYKMYRKEYMKASPALIQKLISRQLLSQVFVGPLIFYHVYGVLSLYIRPEYDAPLPSWIDISIFISWSYFVNQVLFYSSHRLLHTKLLYQRFHKLHHEFIGCIAAATEHATVVEFLFSFGLPTAGGYLTMRGAHPLCFAVWVVLRQHEAYEGHSGYCFTNCLYDRLWLSKATAVAAHDHHHTYNIGCYGNYNIDWLFGTMDNYVQLGGMEGYLALKDSKYK